jgi:hypothetical protein
VGSIPETACSTRRLYEAARRERSELPTEEPSAGDFNAEMVDEEQYASRTGEQTIEGLRITDRKTALRGDWEEQRLYGADSLDREGVDDEELSSVLIKARKLPSYGHSYGRRGHQRPF